MTRLPEGIKISVEGNITTYNNISHTALGRTYRSYLRYKKREFGIWYKPATLEEVKEAWGEVADVRKRSYRYKKILSRLFKRIVWNFKNLKNFNR